MSVMFVYIPKDASFRNTRSWVRRKLKIYANDIEVAAHFVSLMDSATVSSWSRTLHHRHPENTFNLLSKLDGPYGLTDKENPYNIGRGTAGRVCAISEHIWKIINV